MCGSRYRRLWLRCASFQIWSEPKIYEKISFLAKSITGQSFYNHLVLVDVYPAVHEDVVHLHENKDHVQDGVGAKDQVIALNKTH